MLGLQEPELFDMSCRLGAKNAKESRRKDRRKAEKAGLVLQQCFLRQKTLDRRQQRPRLEPQLSSCFGQDD